MRSILKIKDKRLMINEVNGIVVNRQSLIVNHVAPRLKGAF